MNSVPNISFVGRSISRREDKRLLTGRGQFIADLKLPQMLYAAFVRSPLAHARIKAIDVSPAAASPGIIYALSGLELARQLPPVPDTQLALPSKWTTLVQLHQRDAHLADLRARTRIGVFAHSEDSVGRLWLAL